MSSTPPHSQHNTHTVVTLPSVSDTPSKTKQSVSAPVILSNDLDEGREAVVEDVGTAVPRVPIQWFMDHIMPPLPANLDLSAVVQQLKTMGTIGTDTWKDFSVPPAQRQEHEDHVFGALETVARAIGEAAKVLVPPTILEPTVVFRCRPRDTPRSLRRHNDSRPDGFGLYVKHRSYLADQKPIFWETIVASWEVKKRKGIDDVNDNIAKILWSFHHIMRDDPSRRFVVGFTIENTEMRLWFGSRTDALVTDAFDFTRDHETLTRFFLSLTYAKPHELGYDPTMQPAKNILKWANQWDITVHYSEDGDNEDLSTPVDVSKLRTVVMRTETLEASIGAEAMRSRGTRVWSGRVLGPDGTPEDELSVLKDYWVDQDRLREATIRRRILDDAETDEEKALLSKHLLTPRYSGDVVIDGQRDNTRSLLRRGANVPTGAMYPTVHEEISSTIGMIPEEVPGAPQGTGTIRGREERILELVTLCDKSHHRIIFKEVAKTIEHVETVHDVFDAGKQAAKALQAVHKCGWVHRDISSGNILLVDGVVKIADLEYAKKMDDETSHSGRSGTALFMSIEALRHRYLFRRVDLTLTIPPRDLSTRRVAATTMPPSVPDPSTLFRYNPLHDLESLWWILVYLLLARPPDIDGDTEERCDEQVNFYDRAFVPEKLVARIEMFKNQGSFLAGTTKLHPQLLPVAESLEWSRRVLNARYGQAESQEVMQIDHRVADEIASMLAKEFELVAELFEGDADVKLSRIRALPRRQNLGPEQPGAATAIVTSLDSGATTGARKHSIEEHVESIFAMYQEQCSRAKRQKVAELGV